MLDGAAVLWHWKWKDASGPTEADLGIWNDLPAGRCDLDRLPLRVAQVQIDKTIVTSNTHVNVMLATIEPRDTGERRDGVLERARTRRLGGVNVVGARQVVPRPATLQTMMLPMAVHLDGDVAVATGCVP